LNPKNPRLELMAKFLPWHNHTTNNKRRLILFIRDYFNYHENHTPLIEETIWEDVHKILDIDLSNP
jgi:hypothetical protein